MKSRTFTNYIGTRGGAGDIAVLSSYNAEDITALLKKTDAGAAGQVFALNYNLKPFTYDQQLRHNDGASAAYLWLPPDTGTTAHEAVSGVAMTIAGGGSGIVAGNAGATRYAGQYGMLSPTNSAQLTGQGTFLEVSENSAQSWTWEGWLFKNANAAAGVYMETNAGITTYLLIALNAAGVLTVQQSGVVKWTAPAGGSVGAWHHYVLVYNAGAATIQQFIDGVSSGAGTAYARLGTWPGGNVLINSSVNNTAFNALHAVYQNVAFVADDALRHFTDLTTDNFNGPFVATAANITNGGTVAVVFTNAEAPGFDSASNTLRMPLAPLCAIQTAGGVFYAEITVREKELPA